ncbi:hypothetical protein ABGT15_11565 [Flavobacterium enshiense]|uniref:hypothetical protein n=1 Tax=Flavobacterium enshiense TaxID=1341165 RepID=UPI00345D86C4
MSNHCIEKTGTSIFLTLLILLQSCTVYQRTPISIDEAVAYNRSVKVITVTDRKLKFKRIEKTDSVYYGLQKSGGKIQKIALNPNNIKAIKKPDRVTSTLITTTSITASVLFLTYLLLQDSFRWDTDSESSYSY